MEPNSQTQVTIKDTSEKPAQPQWDPKNQLVKAYPVFALQLTQWLDACWADKELADKPYVFEIYRSPERQNELYSIGRRGIEGEKIRTKSKALFSIHQFGCAVDIVKDGVKEKPGLQALWAERAWYKRLDDIACEVCPMIDWSGRWQTFREECHFENRFGLTVTNFQEVWQRVQPANTGSPVPAGSVGPAAEQRLRAFYDMLDDRIALVEFP